MSAKTSIILAFLVLSCCMQTQEAASAVALSSLASETLAARLGWVKSDENNCGGYYLEPPFLYPINVDQASTVEISSNQTLFSQKSTSILEGKVTMTREGQQITANKAYLYRDPVTGKLSIMDLIGDVHLREPNTLIVGKQGRYYFQTKTKSLIDIFYRTALMGKQIAGPKLGVEDVQKQHKITLLSAWGEAKEFSQTEPKVYELKTTSYSTCPPLSPAWQVRASHIILNKNTGRGYATNARILVKNIPVFYVPYINFPIDSRRKSGFLWPIIGGSGQSGPAFYAPFYWNMAPNYDMTITPGLLSKRGVQLGDQFRYLSPLGTGSVDVVVLPSDRLFNDFQDAARQNVQTAEPANQSANVTQAELSRLLGASTTRKGLIWRDESRFNEHWSSHVDFNYVGDDYYARDFGNNINETTQNQLLQEGDVYYNGVNWNFIGRVQAYQTLHPIMEPQVFNQYRRIPQLILNADYPDQRLGLEYFVNNEASHFDILNTPGTMQNLPIGTRFHTQPGISLPIYLPYFYLSPRIQLALTQYNLYQTAPTQAPTVKHRALPIFDLATGFAFTRNEQFFGYEFQQTLEPQVYYTYIPYRNQASIPLFDTTDSTLNYDQLFNYNRFSGIDRIGDANQLGAGILSRLIDAETGLEKARLGIGGIAYFANRRVTLCNNPNNINGVSCADNPFNPNNHRRLSPLSALFDYFVNQNWRLTVNPIIWNPASKQLDNTTVVLHYEPDVKRIINFGYSYARGGDPLAGVPDNSPSNNLKVTDISFAWPVVHDVSAVGRWTQNWNHGHLQNLLYGLEYDTCCWAVQFVGGRTYLNISANNTPQYNTQYFIQFALKGLGNIGRDPTSLLNTITGYNSKFGQEV